jgi:manganese/zinc/iron transport system substrate-binding protein
MERRHHEVRAWMKDNGKIKALCTTAFVGNLVRSVGGDNVAVLDLVNGQNDPHSYQLVKGDDEKFRRADIVFSSGLGLEQGSSLTRYLSLYKACSVGDYIARITQGAIFIGPTVDPHIWMDISLWVRGAKIVAQRLSEKRPDLSEYFRKKASETIKKFMGVHVRLRKILQSIPQEKRYLVTTHDAFHYFCRAYLSTPRERKSEEWKKRCIAPEGFSPESQISTQNLNEVVAYILQHKVKEIFSELGMNQDSLRKVVEVCREKGHQVFISKDFLYSDTMGPQESYEEMMEHNVHTIHEN